MAFFSYKGRDARGQMVQGVLEGADSGAIAGQLFSGGVTPLEIRPSAEKQAPGVGLLARARERKVSDEDVLLFSRQMYTLLKAGVPIMGALKGLQESTDNPTFARVVKDIRESLDTGRELSASLSRHPEVFDAFYVAMVHVGEQTGTLEEVFLRMFHHLEFERFMREQVKSAIRYPAFVLATMGVAIVILNIFVIPAFAKVYQTFKTELPAMTKILIGFSNFMVDYWGLLLGLAVGAVFAFRFWVRTKGGRMQWDRAKLRIPIAGKIVMKATLSRFARSLSLALRSGVPALQSLTMVANTVENVHFAKQIAGMRESVERGESVLRSAAAAGIFTPVVLQMIAVGEESGALDDLLGEVAELYQREVEYELKTLASQIEPVLVLVLGGLVLVVALGVFLPIWDLGQAALGRK